MKSTTYDAHSHDDFSPESSATDMPGSSQYDQILASTLQEYESEMFPLLHAIGLQQAYAAGKTIQFIGTHHAEGTTTISRACAVVAAVRLNKKVLFVESDYRSTPLLPAAFDTSTPSSHLMQAYSTSERPPQHEMPQSSQLHSPRLGEVFQHLRQRHDLIIIDSPPTDASTDGIAIARHTDGVILVVEAEKTRATTVRKLQERITKSGGQILGIVLNKRNYYIPSFIYKYL